MKSRLAVSQRSYGKSVKKYKEGKFLMIKAVINQEDRKNMPLVYPNP